MHSTQFFKKMNTAGFAKKIHHRCHLSIHTEANVSSSRELGKWEFLQPWAQSEIIGRSNYHTTGVGTARGPPCGDGWRSELFWPALQKHLGNLGQCLPSGSRCLPSGFRCFPLGCYLAPECIHHVDIHPGSFHCRWVLFPELLPKPQ